MFQLFVWFVQMLRVIDRRCVVQKVIIIDNTINVENLRVVKARLLVVVHCVQVV